MHVYTTKYLKSVTAGEYLRLVAALWKSGVKNALRLKKSIYIFCAVHEYDMFVFLYNEP